MTPELAARLAPEWASFPTLVGSSYYGQPVKRFDDLRRFYEDNLAQLRRGGEATWESVKIRDVSRRCDPRDLDCRLNLASTSPAVQAPEPELSEVPGRF
jgi:lysozyme